MVDVLEPAVLRDEVSEYRFVCHTPKEQRRAMRLFEKEPGTIAWIARELRPDDVFYDVGANIGSFTVFAGRRLGDDGQVVAFEPHIPNANSLLKNIFLNGLEGRTTLVTAAVSNVEGYAPFNYHSMHAAASTSQYGGTSSEGTTFDPTFVEIKRGCTLDALCGSGLIRPPDLVKIDVDGLDFEVLDGMRSLMASPDGPRSVQVELGSQSEPKIMRLCEELGYVLQEKHWTEAGTRAIAQGTAPEHYYPHCAIFHRPGYR